MHRHVFIKRIIDIKYYTDVPINTFKRFSLPANDNLMRKGELYKLLYNSIVNKGLLDPILVYDLVNVDLNNPPIYKKRKLWGPLIIRGNMRWLVCKDLNISTINVIVAKMDHGKKGGNLYIATDYKYKSMENINSDEEFNSKFKYYNPKAKIRDNHIHMSVPSLTDIDKYGVNKRDKILNNFNYSLPTKNYVIKQKVNENKGIK